MGAGYSEMPVPVQIILPFILILAVIGVISSICHECRHGHHGYHHHGGGALGALMMADAYGGSMAPTMMAPSTSITYGGMAGMVPMSTSYPGAYPPPGVVQYTPSYTQQPQTFPPPGKQGQGWIPQPNAQQQPPQTATN